MIGSTLPLTTVPDGRVRRLGRVGLQHQGRTVGNVLRQAWASCVTSEPIAFTVRRMVADELALGQLAPAPQAA